MRKKLKRIWHSIHFEEIDSLLLGFSLTAILSTIVGVVFGQAANFSWDLNDNRSIQQLLTGTYNTLN